MRRSPIALLAALALLSVCGLPGTTLAQALKLYWADEFAGRIYKSDPDGSNLTTLITGDLLDSAEVVLGGGKLYWSDTERGIIQRANTDGTGLETVVHTAAPGALGLDVGGGKLYWVDNFHSQIRRANLDGTVPETVLYLTHSGTSLTISAGSQFIFWGEYDTVFSQAVIYRRTIAGGMPQQLVVLQGAAQVRGLAVDDAASEVYFGLGNEVRRMDTGGGGMAVLYAGGVNVTAVAVDAAGGKVYWADDGNWDITRSDLDGTGVEALDTFARNADGIAVDVAGAELFWTEERFVVRSGLDGTGQSSIVARPSYVAVGFHDALDRIYYADLQALKTYSAAADGSDRTLFWSGVGVATGGALAIQVDHVADEIYWLDGGDRWLRKADPDGGNREDVMYLSGDAYDIALDLPGARVYWCGRSTGSIYRHNLDASGVTETLYTGLNLPRGLTLDHALGRVIWGEDDQIAHAPINGGGPVTVAFTDPFVVFGIAWDETDSRLYWADQLNSRVRRAEFDLGAGGWQPAETLFSMGLEHWPTRVALQYSIVSGVDDVVAVPAREHYAVPNPFNPTTTVHFRTAGAGVVTVGIYDVRGRLVRELARDTWMPAGLRRLVWDGRDASGRLLASGVYMYRVRASADIMMGKLVLMK
jgi:sugar lactone lactonase YvrE